MLWRTFAGIEIFHILCRFLLPSTHKSQCLWGIIVCPNLGEGIPFQSFSGGQDPCPTLHEKFLSGSDCLTSCLSNARSWHSQFSHMSNISIHITSFLFEHRRQPLKAAALCTVRNEPLATVHDCATMNSLADSYTGSTNCGGSYWRPDFVNPLYLYWNWRILAVRTSIL